MEFHVIPWWNHVRFHGGITQGIETQQWKHAMEFHAEFHGQQWAEHIVHRPPCDGTEPITTWPGHLYIREVRSALCLRNVAFKGNYSEWGGFGSRKN